MQDVPSPCSFGVDTIPYVFSGIRPTGRTWNFCDLAVDPFLPSRFFTFANLSLPLWNRDPYGHDFAGSNFFLFPLMRILANGDLWLSFSPCHLSGFLLLYPDGTFSTYVVESKIWQQEREIGLCPI